MSKQILCARCHEVIGINSNPFDTDPNKSEERYGYDCSGHDKGYLTVRRVFSPRKLYEFTKYYPETRTSSSWTLKKSETSGLFKKLVDKARFFHPVTVDLNKISEGN